MEISRTFLVLALGALVALATVDDHPEDTHSRNRHRSHKKTKKHRKGRMHGHKIGLNKTKGPQYFDCSNCEPRMKSDYDAKCTYEEARYSCVCKCKEGKDCQGPNGNMYGTG